MTEMVEEHIMELTFDHVVVSAVTGSLSLLGVVVNVLCSLARLRLKVFQSSFGILTACETRANAAILLIFLGWCTPATLTGIPDGWQPVNRRLGQLTMFFQEVSFHSILFISINRMIAIVLPVTYRKHFTTKNTLWIVCFIGVISLAFASVQFFEDCYMYFSEDDFDWEYAKTECGQVLHWYLCVLYNLTLFVVVAIIDLITLTKLRMNRKVLNQTKSVSTKAEEKEAQKNHNIEVKFFSQSCLTSLVFALSLILFLKLEHILQTENLATFFATNFVWEIAHLLGGLILVFFNSEIRNAILHPSVLFTKTSSPKAAASFRTTTVAQKPPI